MPAYDSQRAHARKHDPRTSHAAAAAITPHLTTVQRQVLRWAQAEPQATGGFIDPMLQDAMGDQGSTFRTRRRELVDLGLLRDSGLTRKLDGHQRKFIVWSLTPKGRQVQP